VTTEVVIEASRDVDSGEVYVPPRRLAADGSLRECAPMSLPARGFLASWTCYEGDYYGLVDLAHGVRIQVLLGPGPHDVGAVYQGIAGDGPMSFHRV